MILVSIIKPLPPGHTVTLLLSLLWLLSPIPSRLLSLEVSALSAPVPKLSHSHPPLHLCCIIHVSPTCFIECRIAKKLVYGKIRGALGVTKCVVSGGGSLQPHLDEFYEILDLTVLNGWGLSEVSFYSESWSVYQDRDAASCGTQ